MIFLKNLFCLFVFCIFITPLNAQSVSNNKQIQKIVPSYGGQVKNQNSLKQQSYPFAATAQKKQRKNGEFQILGESSFRRTNKVFPKSKTNGFINPAFKGNSFRVNGVFKQDKNIGFQPKAAQENGANYKFRNVPKEVNEKDIPENILKLFKK
ncbi:MAG: hypothetical protein ACJARD_001425 [Alphaproteobacteria bacterium]|jgi:hypothetical protein